MLAEHPRIAIGYAGSGKPPLITGIFEVFEIGAEKFETVRQGADVILASEQMRPDEMTGYGITEPVARLGLQKPVLPPFAARKSPGIKVS